MFGAICVWRRESGEGMSGGICSPATESSSPRTQHCLSLSCSLRTVSCSDRKYAQTRVEMKREMRRTDVDTRFGMRIQAHRHVNAHIRSHAPGVHALLLGGLQRPASDRRHGALRTGIQRRQAWRCRLARA
jgi:hypothetical protein